VGPYDWDFIVNRSTAVGQFEPGEGLRLFDGTPVVRGDEFDIPKSAGVVMPPSAFKDPTHVGVGELFESDIQAAMLAGYPTRQGSHSSL